MKKGVVLGIVVLFIVMSIIPSTATNIRVNKSSFKSLISYLQRKSKYTLKLLSDENYPTNNNILRDE